MAVDRRRFLTLLGASAVGAGVGACASRSGQWFTAVNATPMPPEPESPIAQASATSVPFKLPALPYPTNALEPHIDDRTMQLHHGKHHMAFINRLNEAAKQYPQITQQPMEEVLRNLEKLPMAARTVIRNNGGGHVNHSIYWMIMAPKAGGAPTGEIAKAIATQFGNFDAFKKQFNEAGTKRFGSGWVWLVRDRKGKLQVISLPNQDSPFMEGLYPIMGNDVWEHAYYLKYQNRRAEYLDAWWNVVNWAEVNKRYADSLSYR